MEFPGNPKKRGTKFDEDEDEVVSSLEVSF
jgi:hypothetical protein